MGDETTLARLVLERAKSLTGIPGWRINGGAPPGTTTMTSIDIREQVPHETEFTQLLSLMARMQQTVDTHVRLLHVPLQKLSGEEVCALTGRLNTYLKFELSSEEIEGDIPVCVRGSGLLIASDKQGQVVGSEVIGSDDVVIGRVSGILIRPVPTLRAVTAAQESQSEEHYDDFMISVTAVVEDGLFCVGLDDHGNPSNEHDLSELDVHLAIAYPLKFNPIAIQQ